MLFLAVFCGFLAENWREHLVERKREKQYIRTLITDIETDIFHMSNRISEYSATQTRIDTIINNFDDFTKQFSLKAGENFFYILYYYDEFIYTDRTMQQLKYAGGLRLIKANASDSIIAYDAGIKHLYNQVNYNTEIQRQLIDISTKMISYKNVIRDNDTKFFDHLATGKADFWIKPNNELFQQLYNKLQIYYTTNKYSVDRLKRMRDKGNSLIHFLKNEYGIE
jgi:hypothetical protein